MIIYSSTKQSFIQDFEQGVLVKKLHQTLTEKYRRVSESEIHGKLHYLIWLMLCVILLYRT